jgi:hypothetical protein
MLLTVHPDYTLFGKNQGIQRIVIRLVDEPLTLRRVKNPALWLRMIYRTLSDYHKTIACWLVESAENHPKKQIQDLNLLLL